MANFNNQIFWQNVTFLYTYLFFFSPIVIFFFSKVDKRVGGIALVLLTGLLGLILESKKLVSNSYLVAIKIPHFLHPELGFSLERWETITFSLTFTNVSILIQIVASLVALLAVVCLSSEWKGDKKNITPSLFYLLVLVIFLLSFYAMLDGGLMIELATRLNSFIECLLMSFYVIFDNVESILKLATEIKNVDLGYWVEKEFILSRLLGLPLILFLSAIPLAFYNGYQWLKNWLISRGITTYQLVHITIFLVIPAFFSWVVMGQPWSVVAKVYQYHFSWLPLLIERLSWEPKVIVVVVVMGFLSVISLITGRRVTGKSLKEWWQFLVALIFGISVLLRLDYLAITILDTSFVKNLVVGLAHLGILVTIPPGTLPIPVSHIIFMNMNDPRLQGQRSSLLGLPPSQQGGGAGPGLRGQPFLLDGELIFDPTQRVENTWVDRFLERSRGRQGTLPQLRGSTAVLRWGFEDMSRRLNLSNIYRRDLGFPTPPRLLDIWYQLYRASTASPLLTLDGWQGVKNELDHIGYKVNHFQIDTMNLRNEWGPGLEQIEKKIKISLDFFLTLLLEGESLENLSTLSQRDQETTRRLITELRQSRKLIHHILFLERLEDLTNTNLLKGDDGFPYDIRLRVDSAIYLSPFQCRQHQIPKAMQLVDLLKSMFDTDYHPVYHTVGSFNESESANFLSKISVAHQIAGHIIHQTHLHEVEDQLGTTRQMEILNWILATLDRCPKVEEFDNDILWRQQLIEYFREILPIQAFWIKSFFKYEVSVLNKLELIHSQIQPTNNQVQLVNAGRVEKIIGLRLLEKGLNNLETDVVKGRSLLPQLNYQRNGMMENTRQLPVLRDIIIQLMASQTRT